MRRSGVLWLGVMACLGGCTTILGDFTVTSSTEADDGGADGGIDVAIPKDALVDQRSDHAPDAPASCGADEKSCGGQCVKITDPDFGCANIASCAPCAFPNAAATCTAGACSMGPCVAGWDDCKNASTDGCETHVAVDPANCGKCTNVCNAQGGAPNCGGGNCSSIACTAPHADCNNKPDDGCEVDTSNDVANCGNCAHACGTTNATPACASSRCAFTCTAPFQHCPTSTDADGCNVDTSSDNANCGDCGVVCGSGTHCVGGACACDATSCASGCCASNVCTAHSVTTCGSAGNACADCSAKVQNANGATCNTAGSCAYSSCTSGYLDADADPTNGCESVSPTTVSEAPSYLLLWLAADDFTPSTGSWPDHRGSGNANTCSGAACPSIVAGPHGHNAASFAGAQSISLGGNFFTWTGVTIITVWNPSGNNPDYAPLITFSNPQYANKARVQINQGGQGAWLFQVCDLASSCPFVAGGFWTSGWHRTTVIDAGGTATAYDQGAGQNSAAVALPPSQNRQNNLLGADLFNRFYFGQVAEVLVFYTAISSTSRVQIETYLKNKYGL